MDEDIQELHNEASKLVQAIGRKIGSKHISPEDTETLAEALLHVHDAMKTLNRVRISRYKGFE